MGEEKKKKAAGGEKKTEEPKNPEQQPPPKKEKDPEKSKKPKSEDKKSDEPKETKDNAPPPPPPEIVMRVYMHCEGCARKVRRCLKGFDGVEEVITDCKTHTVVVKGEKADPLKVLDRVQKKTHRQVELLSPIPKPPTEEEKKVEEKKKEEAPKPDEKKEEPKVITVVLKVHMHCEACSLEIKRRIEKMKEVEEATPDLQSSTVSVKGTFDPAKLVEYVHKRTGKHATIVKIDPPPPPATEKKEGGDKGKDGKEENKADEGNKGSGGDEAKEDKKEKGSASGEGGGEDGKVAEAGGDGAALPEEAVGKVELKRNEYYYYPPRYAMEMYAYPPQIFSDENPNACSIM